MRSLSLCMIALLAVVSTGCAVVDQRPDEEVVRERAAARMDALIAQDYERAYGFSSPGYRATNTLLQYQSRFGAAIKPLSAQVGAINCQEEVCKIQIDYTFRYMGRMSQNSQQNIITRTNEEEWIKVDGQWWFFKLR